MTEVVILLSLPPFHQSGDACSLWYNSENDRNREVLMVRRWWAVLILGVWLMGCQPRSTYPKVHLQVAEGNPVVDVERASGKLPLRVAVAAVISPRATFDIYSPLLDYLAARLDRPVELLQRPTYAEINELIRTGQADIGFVCGGAFVEGERDGYMELLAVPQIEGKSTYQAYVIVRAESPYQSLEDLRGNTFAFTDPLSNSGHLYIQYRLAEAGETPETFFEHTIYTFSHDNSIHAVAQGLVDGATVDSLVYQSLLQDEPLLAEQLRVVEQSPPMGIPPVVVHPALDSDLKATLQQALLSMHQDTQGKDALTVLRMERFLPPNPAAYEDIRRMSREVRDWEP